MYKIGIVGYGVVGKGIHGLFKEDVAAIYDPHVNLTKGAYKTDKESFRDLDLIVVCVPTNESADWSANVSLIWESVDWIIDIGYKGVVLIKSTTPPSVLEKIQEGYKHTVFSPEYMGESRYFTPFWKYPDPKEMKMHDFQIFGGNQEDTSFCVDVFVRIMGPHVRFYQTDIKTAALAKYMENSFFAMKVTFCNEWYEVAKAHGVDYNALRELWLADSRVSPMHTMVMPKDRGYGGKCYPKDTRAIIKDTTDVGYVPELMRAADKVNIKFRELNRIDAK